MRRPAWGPPRVRPGEAASGVRSQGDRGAAGTSLRLAPFGPWARGCCRRCSVVADQPSDAVARAWGAGGVGGSRSRGFCTSRGLRGDAQLHWSRAPCRRRRAAAGARPSSCPGDECARARTDRPKVDGKGLEERVLADQPPPVRRKRRLRQRLAAALVCAARGRRGEGCEGGRGPGLSLEDCRAVACAGHAVAPVAAIATGAHTAAAHPL